MIEKIREIVFKEYDEWDRKYHIPSVVKNAKLLAKKLGADEELAELGALLHDIGRPTRGEKDHEKTGPEEAEKILKEVGYPSEIIEEIKHVVESHRGSGSIRPKTKIAEIVSNADGMSHYDIFPAMIQIVLKQFTNFDEAIEWLDEKMERNWNKKLTLPEAKEIVKDKYHAIRLIMDSMKEYTKG
jgi:putative nucleotidyltransferase with HDIG domain